MAKIIRNIRNLLICSCWASSSKTRERNYTRDIRAFVYSPVPENGNGEIKTKQEYVRNGPFRLSPFQLPFNTRSPPVFFERAPVVRIERGNFFLRLPYIASYYILNHSHQVKSLSYYLLNSVHIQPPPVNTNYFLSVWS